MALIISSIKYMCIFMVSIFFFKQSEKELDLYNPNVKIKKYTISKRKLYGFFFALIGMLVISIFAGIRANDVGTDTNGYPVTFMRLARSSSSLHNLLTINSDLSNEPLGAILVYLCSLFTDKTWLLLFFYQFLTIIPIFLSAYEMKDKLSISNVIIVYCLMFFNNSLNMMRQSVVCALILYAFVLVINNKSKLRILIILLISIAFHRSSIYGIILVLASYYALSIGNRKLKYIVYILIILFPAIIPQIANIVAKITADEHILFYFKVFIEGTAKMDWFVNPLSSYSIIYILVSLCYLLMPILFNTHLFQYFKRLNTHNKSSVLKNKIETMNLIGFLIYLVILFSIKTMYGIRFSIFFDYLYMISIPLSVRRNKTYQNIMIFLLWICWVIWIIRMGWSGSEIYHTFF